jgi:hypothetical protein
MGMHGPILHLARCVCAVPLLTGCVLIGSAITQGTPARLDSSDWWSYTRQEELPVSKPSAPVRFQKREPAEGNFQIGGITLREPRDFSEIRSMFGEATEVERGDAASGRNQICYTSPSGSVHLIFEFGELDSVLYLFDDGPGWNGSELCAPSKSVSSKLSTASGLRLGETPQQVKDILGEPSLAAPEKLVYYFEYRKKSTPKELLELRKNYPDMNDEEFAKNFEFADGEVYIEARFASEKLNYLAISKSETY